MNRKIVDSAKTTQICPECGSKYLALIGSQNVKLCTQCPTTIVWVRSEGQSAVHGGPSTLVE